ncbi:MAG TPA: hypothetical protein VHC21_02620 [Candidatus Saccharimonadales bacterium]|nr:hypothetical protein [Candidatus Saccharimonadales bacterium]
MAETYQLAVNDDARLMEVGVSSWRTGEFEGRHVAFLAQLGRGAVRFAEATFPGASSVDQIYAQFNERESEGRGPHFDIYNEGLDENYPWLGVYNLAGTCEVAAATLPDDMAKQYAELYPEPNEAAHAARRHYGALVLGADTSRVGTGTLEPDMGLILPQRPQGPHIIHEVVPKNAADPGAFIKMIVPKKDEENLELIGEQGFMLLDELLTGAIEPAETENDFEPTSILPPAPGRRKSRRRPQRRSGRRIVPNFSSGAMDRPDGLLD